MTLQVFVAGKADVYIAPAGGVLQFLGNTQNGVRRSVQVFKGNVSGDENGGDEGAPIEIQLFGEIHRPRLELTKFDPDVGALILPLMARGSPGIQYPSAAAEYWPGDLVFANNAFYRLCIKFLNGSVWNYPCATFLEDPYELNGGTKFSTWVLNPICYKHPTTGILWDSTGI